MNRLALLAASGLAALSAWAVPARAQDMDAAELVVRLGRVEGQMRQLSGQVEQLQFENRRLRDQVSKFQEDVEFRFNERGGSGGGAARPAPAPSPSATPAPARRSEAPDAPATPRGSGTAAAPSAAPAPPGGSRDGIGALIQDQAILDLGNRTGNPAAAAPARGGSVAAASGGEARGDYDAAYALVQAKQYDGAEMALRRYLQSHPRDRMVPDATYWLGESYFQRSRFREAAEQFLKVSTEHARATRAPDAFYRLGAALAALGARDQACATFAEFGRKYPSASGGLKQGVDREQKKARCAA